MSIAIAPKAKQMNRANSGLPLPLDSLLEEVVAGYLWRGEVLRQSEVVAVKN